MGIRVTLKRELAIFIVSLAVILVSSYTAILPVYFGAGLVEASNVLLEVEAADYDRRRAENPQADFPNTNSLKGYVGLDSVPADILQLFPVETHVNRTVHQNDNDEFEGEGDF